MDEICREVMLGLSSLKPLELKKVGIKGRRLSHSCHLHMFIGDRYLDGVI